MLSISKMSKEELEQEILKGIEDIENGRVHKFEDVEAVFKWTFEGDKYLASNDYENAEKAYLKSTMICEDKYLSSYGYYKLGLLYYKFQKPDILYSKAYFELALKYGEKNASYYLATIYEWENENENTKYNSETINDLYKLASEEAYDDNVKKLAFGKYKK